MQMSRNDAFHKYKFQICADFRVVTFWDNHKEITCFADLYILKLYYRHDRACRTSTIEVASMVAGLHFASSLILVMVVSEWTILQLCNT